MNAPQSDPRPAAQGAQEPVTTPSLMGRVEATRLAWRQAIGPRGTYTCHDCNESFAREGYLLLHKGRRHEGSLDTATRSRFEAVRAAEAEVMQEIAVHTKCGLWALPIFLAWAAVLVLLIEMNANIAWMVMSTPGYVLFAGLVYVMVYGYLTGGRTSYYGHQ
jgi:hypothetical protein